MMYAPGISAIVMVVVGTAFMRTVLIEKS